MRMFAGKSPKIYRNSRDAFGVPLSRYDFPDPVGKGPLYWVLAALAALAAVVLL